MYIGESKSGRKLLYAQILFTFHSKDKDFLGLYACILFMLSNRGESIRDFIWLSARNLAFTAMKLTYIIMDAP